MSLIVSPTGRKYGALIDAYDSRDKKLAASMPLFKKLAAKYLNSNVTDVSLLDKLGPVKDQGNLGACTGFANAGLREFLYRAFFDQEKDQSVPTDQMIFSPLNLYYEERAMQGTVTEDSGADMRTGMLVLNQYGVCPESVDPYNITNFAVAPTPEQILAAKKYVGGAYHRLDQVWDMKACLRSGYAFTLGFDVYESFESNAVATTGRMPTPNTANEKLLGGHAVLVYGYSDSDDSFLVRNSWGSNWGKNGNFYFPYEAVPMLVSDAWMMHLGKAWIAKS